MDRFKRKSCYIKLNFYGAYNLIHIKEGEKQKMVFQIKYRHYEYIVILFKLINIPTIMQSLVNNILREYLDKFYIIYLNNILIFLDSEKKYKKYIITILKILEKIEL